MVARIAGHMKGDSRTLWLLMNDTGLRVSDAVKLRYSDIDSDGRIHYKSQKTGKTGIISVSGAVLSLIPRKKSDDFVFKSARNPKKHIHRSTVFRHIKQACSLCGINAEGIAPHSARKSFAVKDFRENGLGKTMHDLQHSSPATTLFYALSDDPIPEIFKELRRIKKRLSELEEICDMIVNTVFDTDEPLKVSLSDK